MRLSSSLVMLASSLVPIASARSQTGPAAPAQSPDGALVPFTSELPPCATYCGPLFDVQGSCLPANKDCFCNSADLKPFLEDGTAGVSGVCGPASCTAAADLDKIKSWYSGFCGAATTNPTTTTAPPGSTSTSPAGSGSGSSPSNGGHQTWIQSHYKWVIMVVVVFGALIGGWILAAFLRRRYLRKKEREIEMRPPIAWGPHQMQAMTGGYNTSDGALSTSATPVAKDSRTMIGTALTSPDPPTGQRESHGWLLTKERP